MRLIRLCKYLGFIGFGTMLAAMFEYGAQTEIVWGFILSILIIALAVFNQGTIKEDHYETNYVQYTGA